MYQDLLVDTFGLVIALSLPIVGAIVIGGAVAGLIQGFLRVGDISISYLGRLLGLVTVLSFLGIKTFDDIADFARALWGDR